MSINYGSTNQRQTLEEYEAAREKKIEAATRAAEEALSGRGPSPDYYYNNNTNNDTGRVQKQWLPEEGERIVEAYCANVAESMTMAVARMIEGAYQAGLTVDEIILAIEETGLAPKPSPRYLRAILANWMANGRCIARVKFYSQVNDSRLAWWRRDERR